MLSDKIWFNYQLSYNYIENFILFNYLNPTVLPNFKNVIVSLSFTNKNQEGNKEYFISNVLCPLCNYYLSIIIIYLYNTLIYTIIHIRLRIIKHFVEKYTRKTYTHFFYFTLTLSINFTFKTLYNCIIESIFSL